MPRQVKRYIFTESAQQSVLDLIARGNYPDAAARASGINLETLMYYLNEGERDPAGAWAPFAEAYRKAESISEIGAVDCIVGHVADKSMPGDWRAAAMFLSRRWPDRWSGRSRSSDDVAPMSAGDSVVVVLPRNGREARENAG
jgi:hypothetical protein